MKKEIIIIVDKDVPVRHLLNDKDYDIYEAIGNQDIFTMVSKVDQKLAPTEKVITIKTNEKK